MRPYSVLAISFAAFTLTAAAQSAAIDPNWAGVTRLTPGTEIRVFLAGEKTIRGFLQGATADSIAINAATSQETLARRDVKRVQLRRPSHRGRNTLLGLAIGAGAGLAIGAGADNNSSGGLFLGRDAGKIVFTPMGAIVGTVVGVALPTGGWRDIYRVR